MFPLPPKKKTGRPTDNPKRYEIKAHIGDEAYRILDDYCEEEDTSKAEGIRNNTRRLEPDIIKK